MQHSYNPTYYCVMIGGISVTGKQGANSKTAVSGTIPTELGNLKAWKYVIFGKSINLNCIFILFITMQYEFISSLTILNVQL